MSRMEPLSDRLALLLKHFRSWDPRDDFPMTAVELSRKYDVELGVVIRLAKSEGVKLSTGEPRPLELTLSEVEIIDNNEPEVGSKIGRYELTGKLGQGGMGVVYSAYDPTLNRRIAIKLLRSDLSKVTDESPQDARRRILREAQAMAQVSSHPNIVPVYDVGTYGDRVFIAMEYVEGEPINDFIEKRNLSWQDTISLYLDAAKGLIAAHDMGLVHRDFKPDNVLVDNARNVKVMDFGLARSVAAPSASMVATKINPDEVSLNTTLTVTGQVMGTPAYMAPEQFMLEEVDARSDQFAFCVSMYEALTGYRPYQADSFRDLALKVLNQRTVEPPRDSNVPDWIFDSLFKGLSSKKNDRWASMAHLCEALTEEPPHILAAARKRINQIIGILVAILLSSLVIGFEAWKASRPVSLVEEPTTPSLVPDGIEVPYDTITAKEVHTVVWTHTNRVRKCYSELRKTDPDLIGRVVLDFKITTEGKVVDPYIVSDTFKDGRIADCVMASTLFWEFPRMNSLTNIEVRYPFVFSGSTE